MPLAQRPDSRDNGSTAGTAGCLIFASVGLVASLLLSCFYFFLGVLVTFSWGSSVMKLCVGRDCRDLVEIWMLVAVATPNFPDFWLH